MVERRQKAVLLGLGLDGNDGVVRVTRAENFHLIGGSDQTHSSMQDKCVKFNEKLQARGKQIEQLERREFLDIAADCEMNILSAGANPRGSGENS